MPANLSIDPELIERALEVSGGVRGAPLNQETRDLCGSCAHPGKHGPKLSAGLIQFACARAAVKRRKASGLQ